MYPRVLNWRVNPWTFRAPTPSQLGLRPHLPPLLKPWLILIRKNRYLTNLDLLCLLVCLTGIMETQTYSCYLQPTPVFKCNNKCSEQDLFVMLWTIQTVRANNRAPLGKMISRITHFFAKSRSTTDLLTPQT